MIAPTEVSNSINAQNLVLPGGTAEIGSVKYNVVLNSSPALVDALNDIHYPRGEREDDVRA